tara:strand:+ start:683 stop:964 length:282 start_codon:yes stop_codon:yes gene_type:complete
MGNTKNIMSLKQLKSWLRNEKDFSNLIKKYGTKSGLLIKKKKINLIKKEIQIRSRQLLTSTDKGWYEHDHLNKEVMREHIKHWTWKLNKGETL